MGYGAEARPDAGAIIHLHPQMAVLVDALGHKERDLRQSAQRELNQLTGEYLGYFHDAPKAERDAAITRWRTWVDANKTRLDLP